MTSTEKALGTLTEAELEALESTKDYLADPYEALRFFFLSSKDDFETAKGYEPDFVETIWPEEKIPGYKNLSAKIYVNMKTLDYYIDMQYDDRMSGSPHLETGMTDPLKDRAFINFHSSKESFFATFDEKPTLLPGLHKVPVLTHFKFMRRLDLLLRFFVEDVIPINVDDSDWEMYTVANEEGYLMAYMCAYRFYQFPDRYKLRLSQIWVLPMCEGEGHASALMDQLISEWSTNSGGVEVDVESPCDDMLAFIIGYHIPRILRHPELSVFLTEETVSKERLLQLRHELGIPVVHALHCYEMYHLVMALFAIDYDTSIVIGDDEMEEVDRTQLVINLFAGGEDLLRPIRLASKRRFFYMYHNDPDMEETFQDEDDRKKLLENLWLSDCAIYLRYIPRLAKKIRDSMILKEKRGEHH
ncbi:hypothetical protein PCE1_000923 [Barthelona sp. PCE]